MSTIEVKTTGECTCGSKFLDAEDYRDHLPCPGNPIALTERSRIVAWLRSYDDAHRYDDAHLRSALADRIERGEHLLTPSSPFPPLGT